MTSSLRSSSALVRNFQVIGLAVLLCVLARPAPTLGGGGEGRPGTPPDTLTVMPLGDSITLGLGSSHQGGYRLSLFQQLTDAGYAIDLVGSLNNGPPPPFDPDHEGHSGWHTDYLAGRLPGFLEDNPPEIILLHIGTNDVLNGIPSADEVADLLDIVDQFEADSGTHVTVYLARIILAAYGDFPQQIMAFNDAVEAMALDRIALGDDIVIVNQQDALDYPQDLPDWVHPNDDGYEKMADVWFAALNAFLPPQTDVFASNVHLDFDPFPGPPGADLVCTWTPGPETAAAAVAWLCNWTPVMSLFCPFEGGVPAAWLDFSGNEHPIAVVGGVVWSPGGGQDGAGCLSLAGAGHLDAGEVLTCGAYTKTAWVYRLPGDPASHILSGGPGESHGFLVANSPEQPEDHRLRAGHHRPWSDVVDPEIFRDDQWVHVGVTYDPDSNGGELILYRDGLEVDRIDGIAPPDSARVLVGAGGLGADRWRGEMDDVRVYCRALSAEQMLALYLGQSERMVGEELAPGERWQAYVTPYSADGPGPTVPSPIRRVGVPTGIPPGVEPLVGPLVNYPNPFNPRTVIRFELARQGNVTLRIFDLTGGLITILWNGTLAAGDHQIPWAGVDGLGRKLPSGSYLARVESEGQISTGKAMLVR